MALGSLLIRLLGMRVRHQALFERMLKAGATGLGYGDPAMGRRSQHLEHTALRHCAARWAGTSPVIFDVGANRGQYIGLVRELAGHLKPRIHAFEPNPTLAVALQQAHGADPLVQVHDQPVDADTEDRAEQKDRKDEDRWRRSALAIAPAQRQILGAAKTPADLIHTLSQFYDRVHGAPPCAYAAGGQQPSCRLGNPVILRVCDLPLRQLSTAWTAG